MPGTQQINSPEQIKETVQIGFISGLKLSWTNASGMSISSGAAYIQSLGYNLNVTGTISKSNLVLSSSTTYHVYLYLNGASPDFELSTTAPVLYYGTACQKTGDSSRRYLGSILTNSTAGIYSFLHSVQSGLIYYMNQQDASPFRVLANGKATTETTIACNTVVPVTSRVAKVKFSNTDAGQNCWIGNSADGIVLSAGVAILGVNVSTAPIVDIPLDGSQAMTYLFTALPASGLYVDVYGYWMER